MMKFFWPDMILILASTALLMALSGCGTTAPNYNEASGPTVYFTQTATGSTPVTVIGNVDVDNASAPVSFNAVATDPGGVQSITLEFDQDLFAPNSSCGTTSGAIYGGGTIPYAPIPVAQSDTSSVQNGQVPTELFVIGNLNGPFTCDLSAIGIQGINRPYGATIHATATATNYSGKTTTVVLPITFQGWP
jgi:hypothetical protein